MEAKIIEQSGRGNEYLTRYASPLQLLERLREHAGRSNNLPDYESMSRLIQLIKDESLDEDDVPVKQLLTEIENFQQGTVNKNDFLIRVLGHVEEYGARVEDLHLSQELEQLTQKLQVRANELTEKANLPAIDFAEIPPANKSDGEQDSFELFAAEFLEGLGYVIEEGPSRGADGGRDLIVLEPLSGIFSTQNRRWLVSCKHKAHSGRSVGVRDESDIGDRVNQHQCDGFMAFYSTLPSSGLEKKLRELQNHQKRPIPVEVFHKARIERLLLSEDRLQPVFARYFRRSYKKHQEQAIRLNFELETLVINHEYERRREEAIRRRGAVELLRAQRDYERKQKLAEKQRDLRLAQLAEE